jgi:organic hydroperoxide reductase OsmC/OhrA
MAPHSAIVTWERLDAKFTDNRYSRAHRWQFDGGVTVPASSSPHVVSLPYSDAANVDPEEAFVAALSSCHMLWFLYIAAKNGFIVDSYTDNAQGFMEKDESKRMIMSKVILSPVIVFSGPTSLSEADVESLHHQAHENCYLANSVKTNITINGSWSVQEKIDH